MMTADQISSPLLLVSQLTKNQCEPLQATFVQELFHLLPLSPSDGNLRFPSSSSLIQGGMQIVTDRWYKGLKMKTVLQGCCFHLCYKRVRYLTEGHFCPYQSILLEITKLQNKCINEVMQKACEDWDTSKIHLNLYWFPVFPSLCWYWLVILFHRRMCPTSLQVTSLGYGSPCLCSPELWHSHGMMRSTSAIPESCNAQLVPTLLISLLLPLNPYLP